MIVNIKIGKVFEMNLDIRQKVTIIRGNSGTGKTYMIDLISRFKDGKEQLLKMTGLETNKIYTCMNDREVNVFINEYSRKSLVFIDRWDVYGVRNKKRLVELINLNDQTIWVIVSRKLDLIGVDLGMNNVVELNSYKESGVIKFEITR